MRVLHLTRDLPPRTVGGLSTAVGGLVQVLTDEGHTCAVLSFDAWRPRKRPGGAAEAPDPGPHVSGAPTLRLSSSEELDRATDFAIRHAPDLLHVHHGMLWPYAAELVAALGVPAAFTVHVHQASLSRLRKLTETTLSLEGQERALREADVVLAPSEACAAALRADHPELEVRTTPLGLFDTASARSAAASRGSATGGPLLYVGRFADVKGTSELFTLARQLLASTPSLEVLVVGGVPGNPRSERRWRRRWAEDTPPELVDRLQFAGWCEAEALSAHYASARALVVPSWTETFGLTVLEGMLHGVPVVASACPALAELLDDGRTGLLAPVGEVAAFEACVERLLADDRLATGLGRAAAERARNQHLWPQVVARTVAAYKEVVAAGQRGH